MTEETAGGAHPCESPRARVPRCGCAADHLFNAWSVFPVRELIGREDFKTKRRFPPSDGDGALVANRFVISPLEVPRGGTLANLGGRAWRLASAIAARPHGVRWLPPPQRQVGQQLACAGRRRRPTVRAPHLCPPHVTEEARRPSGPGPAAAEKPTVRPFGMRRSACALLFNRRTWRRALDRYALSELRVAQLRSAGARAEAGVAQPVGGAAPAAEALGPGITPRRRSNDQSLIPQRTGVMNP